MLIYKLQMESFNGMIVLVMCMAESLYCDDANHLQIWRLFSKQKQGSALNYGISIYML